MKRSLEWLMGTNKPGDARKVDAVNSVDGEAEDCAGKIRVGYVPMTSDAKKARLPNLCLGPGFPSPITLLFMKFKNARSLSFTAASSCPQVPSSDGTRRSFHDTTFSRLLSMLSQHRLEKLKKKERHHSTFTQ
jgi:hypothetical protein